MADAAARKFQHQQSVIFTRGFAAMDQARTPGHHLCDFVFLSKKIASRFDAVAAEVIHGSAAGFLNIPEVRTVRPAVRFPRTHPQHAAEATLLDGLPGFDYAG